MAACTEGIWPVTVSFDTASGTVSPSPEPVTVRGTSQRTLPPKATTTPSPHPTLPPPTTATSVPRPPIIPRTEWGALPPSGDYVRQTPVALVLHHEGVYFDESTMEASAAYIRKVQKYCMGLSPQEDAAGFPWVDIAYHFLIDRQGRIYGGRPVDARPNSHTYDCSGHIAIAVLGDYTQQVPNPEQIQAVIDLMVWLAHEYGIPPAEIYAHRDFGGTSCPGENLYRHLEEIRAAVRLRLGQ